MVKTPWMGILHILSCLHGWTWSRQVGQWVEELVVADWTRVEEASMVDRHEWGSTRRRGIEMAAIGVGGGKIWRH